MRRLKILPGMNTDSNSSMRRWGWAIRKDIALPSKSWDLWRECNSCLGCGCWHYHAWLVGAFYSYEGNNFSHRYLVTFEKIARAVLSTPWQHRQVPDCHFTDYHSTKLSMTPQVQGPTWQPTYTLLDQTLRPQEVNCTVVCKYSSGRAKHRAAKPNRC